MSDYPTIRRGRMARMNPSAFTLMLSLMLDKPQSVKTLAMESGLAEWTVRNYCKSMVLGGIAYIAGWEPDSMDRDSTALYMIGRGRLNVPRRQKTGAQRQRERRARVRRDALETNQRRSEEGL